ncbi:MAG TPA: GNAT family N-acetyltransferase [Dehalococcoidia bacterium]|nr:GNAT family N-acetyltransferase [Dehalococcoidia bacterium]
MAELRLVRASLEATAGLVELLREIGEGESGFSGEREVVAGPVATGALSAGFDVEAVLRRLVDMAAGRNLPDGYVPMTTFWALDETGAVVGVSRLRHRLNDSLLLHGGHIGYYVARSERGKGYATEMLRQTLLEARGLGIERALLTVESDNAASIRVIEHNGGVLEDEVAGTTPGRLQRRYWIEVT